MDLHAAGVSSPGGRDGEATADLIQEARTVPNVIFAHQSSRHLPASVCASWNSGEICLRAPNKRPHRQQAALAHNAGYPAPTRLLWTKEALAAPGGAPGADDWEFRVAG